MEIKTKSVPFVDLKAQHIPLQDEINQAISSVMERTAFILGPEVKDFEEAFAKFSNAKFAVGVSSGTAALELALRAYEIGEGDEVITAANTFIATALGATHTGATPVLVDIDERTYNIDVEKVQEAITPNTKAIIPVHLYGQPADMDPIMDLAEKHGLVVIEDACQAHGATYKGRVTGSLGHTAAFSFYPSKNLGACGDAGIVVTNDEKVAEYVRMVRNVGQSQKYHHAIIGHNHRIDNLQAAILEVKLRYLDQWTQGRRNNANKLNQLLDENNAITIPFVPEFADPVWHLYVIRVQEREAFQKFMGERNIGTGIHYPIPIHLQEAYSSLGYHEGDFPVTEKVAKEIVSLPMFPEMSDEQIDYVVSTIKEFTD